MGMKSMDCIVKANNDKAKMMKKQALSNIEMIKGKVSAYAVQKRKEHNAIKNMPISGGKDQ